MLVQISYTTLIMLFTDDVRAAIKDLKIVILNLIMFVTKVLKNPKKDEYLVLTQKVLIIEGEEIKFDFRSIGKDGKEERLESIAEYRNLGPPLSLGLYGSNPYLSREDLLGALSASGVKPEEIEKLKPRL